ncbi:MAG: DNA polymerase III subunit alpha, partial [Bacteroidales bacterium]
MGKFTHLHVHSQYSILDGAASIDGLISKAKELGMDALALTDHGNLLGLKEFHAKCLKNNIKPILGCETYVAKNSLTEKSDSVDKSGYHLILLAKNLTGYHNLIKMISVANLDGFYSRPRIDKKLLLEHKEGIIVSSACLGGEIPKLIASGQIDAAKETILWFKENFGDDFYLEVMHHPCNDPVQKREVSDVQELVNEKIFELSSELGIRVIATNDVHFINEEDAEAHDVLICLTTNSDINDPNRLRYTKQEWFKSYDEMLELFPDHPEVLENTNEIADKVEIFEIDRNPLMPEFPIPESFGTMEEWRNKFSEEDLKNEFTEERYKILGGYDVVLRIKLEADYLRFLTEKGAVERYGKNYSDEVKERIEYELLTIKRMGYPGYFLIVQDFIQKAREMGVLVGKGRGSAAGSVVAYCTKITDVDPLKFDLLFERFLNPDRISMPDVDIDFDDDGRAKVIEYVVNKYGKDKVAHICTIGTMKAKGAIKDVFRIMGIDLNFSNELTKKLDDKASLSNAYAIIEKEVESLGSYEKYLAKLDEEIKTARKEENDKLKDILEARKVIAETMQIADQKNDEKLKKALAIACVLEGSVRQTGVHACGMLIGREALVNNIPLMRTKDGDLATTQYEGTFVESIGLLKMDF